MKDSFLLGLIPKGAFAFLVLVLMLSLAPPASAASRGVPENRVASVFVSQDFINELLSAHTKSDLIKEMKIALDPNHGQIFMRGKIQVPVEELRAINLDTRLGAFSFQVTIKPEVTKQGYLILEFPLDETFFYPESSTDPVHDRVIVPVQMLSVALASARGYLAALSGDFSGFNRRSQKLTALLKDLNRSISLEKNSDALEELKTQRASLRLQLAAVPIERKQLQTLSKQVEHILGFTGEKELNINDELVARKNALILKIKLSQLVPYLNGVELGGVRILHDKKDGGGQNYLAIDVNSLLAAPLPPRSVSTPTPRAGMTIAPSLIVRLNQSIFESTAVIDAEKKEMGSNLRNLDIELKDDGLHVSGGWHPFIFFTIPFETVVDFVTTGTDTFEILVREMKVAGLDFKFLTKFVLESMASRLDHALKGICTFKYVGEEKDYSRAIQVTVEPKVLVPAFPDLHLVDVDVREQEFLLKIGRP